MKNYGCNRERAFGVGRRLGKGIKQVQLLHEMWTSPVTFTLWQYTSGLTDLNWTSTSWVRLMMHIKRLSVSCFMDICCVYAFFLFNYLTSSHVAHVPLWHVSPHFCLHQKWIQFSELTSKLQFLKFSQIKFFLPSQFLNSLWYTF